MNDFMLVYGKNVDGGNLRSTEILLLFRSGAGASSQSNDYALMQLLDMAPSKETVIGTLGCVCLRRRTDDEPDYSLK